MAKVQLEVLLKALDDAGDVGLTREAAAFTLSVKTDSVPVYFHWLKKYNVTIETVKEGKRVVRYILRSDPNNVYFGSTKKGKVPQKKVVATKPLATRKVVASKPLATKEVRGEKVVAFDTDLEIASLGDREFSDLRESLGLGGSFGSSWD